MTSSLVERAQGGDERAFQELTAPYLRELHLHCYRMLGSVTDADDLLQEILLAAWTGLGGFAGRASLRTWLYRIATNRCLNAIRDGKRRPPTEPLPPFDPPEPTHRGDITWLQPYPDAWLEDHAVRRETVELAFITALQRVPPRQTATLVLVDVLGFTIAEVADLMDTSPTAAKGALQRARATMRRASGAADEQMQPAGTRGVAAAMGSAALGGANGRIGPVGVRGVATATGSTAPGAADEQVQPAGVTHVTGSAEVGGADQDVEPAGAREVAGTTGSAALAGADGQVGPVGVGGVATATGSTAPGAADEQLEPTGTGEVVGATAWGALGGADEQRAARARGVAGTMGSAALGGGDEQEPAGARGVVGTTGSAASGAAGEQVETVGTRGDAGATGSVAGGGVGDVLGSSFGRAAGGEAAGRVEGQEIGKASHSPAREAGEWAVARRFAEAFVADDIEAVTRLLTDDAWLAMPPAPHEYQGAVAIAAFLRASANADGRRGARLRLEASGCNRQPGFVCYFVGEDQVPWYAGRFVLTVDGERISRITRFLEPALEKSLA
jgi:RNA polymerase sigma factor (sigma-70 family)